MRQFFNQWHTRFLSGLLACGLAAPAFAQQSPNTANERDNRSSVQDRQQKQERERIRREQSEDRRDRGSQQMRDRRREDGQQADRQRRGQQVRLQPAGWITIGVDYDQDGRFDAVERIFAFDLETAREQSQRRRGDSTRGDRTPTRGDRVSTRGDGAEAQRTVDIRGELRDLQKFKMRDDGATYILARVDTDQGRTAKVLLGQDERLTKLDLNEGDRIQVKGRRGTVNRRGILVASEVRSGDQRVKVEPKTRMRQAGEGRKEQLQGSVVRTRTANFRGYDDPFLVAEIRTREGERRLVNMGPKSKFDDVEFADAGEIRVVGNPGRVSGQQALIAEKVRVDGQNIVVKPSEQRDQQWREQEDGAESRDRSERERRRLGNQDRGRDGRLFDRESRDRERQLLNRGDREEQQRDRRFLNRGEDEDRESGRGLLNRGEDEEQESDRRSLNRGEREDRQRDRGEDRQTDR